MVSTRPAPATPPAPPPRAAADVWAQPLGSRGATFAACLGVIACVGGADYLTGPEISVIIFYLVPIGFGTWFLDLRAGLLLSLVSAAVSTTADAMVRLDTGAVRFGAAGLTWNGAVQLGTFVALAVVLSALRTRLQGEELLARTDALTRIANRRAFFETAALEIERVRRTGRPIALAFVDVDDFKDVNDRLGHAQGDALLVALAATLRRATRAIDAVARLGGDEFALLLPETSAAETEALLARVRAALVAEMARGGWNVGFSIGAAVFVAPPRSVDDLIARADELMYAAKRAAKGSVRIATFGPEDRSGSAAGRA